MKKQKSVLAVLGSIVLVSAFLIVACGGSENKSGRSEPPQSTSQPPQEQGPETSTPAQEVPTPRFYKVGEVVTIPGAVKITVTQVKRMPFSQADPGYTPEKGWPKSGSFLVLSVTMTNLGSQPLSVMGLDYGLRDAEGNTPSMSPDPYLKIGACPHLLGSLVHSAGLQGGVTFLNLFGRSDTSGSRPLPVTTVHLRVSHRGNLVRAVSDVP